MNRLLSAIAALCLLVLAASATETGTVKVGRWGPDASLDSEPGWFYLFVFLYAVMSFVFLVLAVRGSSS